MLFTEGEKFISSVMPSSSFEELTYFLTHIQYTMFKNKTGGFQSGNHGSLGDLQQDPKCLHAAVEAPFDCTQSA